MARLTPLPAQPVIPAPLRRRLAEDFARLPAALPPDWAGWIRERYCVDVSARYGSIPLRHPFGKGSGQLSLQLSQVEEDAEAALAFVVLKTVIAEDPQGKQSMGAWAIPESRMRVERRRSASGAEGWTVTWKGRGWDRSLEEYLQLVRAASALGAERDMPVVASLKYHLPDLSEPFREAEYQYTTRALVNAWSGAGPLALEHDFSPTLAGDALAQDQARIVRWLLQAPALIRRGADTSIHLGVKVMNAGFNDAFQVDMVRAAAQAPERATALVLFNRLWDPAKGVAYGGWDLSDRNLRVLDLMVGDGLTLGFCATGNIQSGRLMVEYARRGAACGQLHTYFQLPRNEFALKDGSRTACALHTLFFHPSEGLIAWLLHLAESGVIEPVNGVVRFLDVARG